MPWTRYYGALFAVLLVACDALAEVTLAWPDKQRMAISLSYDDALDSQLDNAIPALNSYGFRASFYLTLASPTMLTRLAEWRTAAAQGHELGNHSIYHPCSASLPDREWVASYYNIDEYRVTEIRDELRVANSFLHAIDGRTERTLTTPCGDVVVSGENYVPAVRDMFIAIKGFEPQEAFSTNMWVPSGVSGGELIDRIEAEASKGTGVLNIVFHGIGGDHLAVSVEAHDQLLEYLDDNRDKYWVDSYISIMKYAANKKSP